MSGHQFNFCVACSQPILEEFKKNPWEFCLRVFNSPLILEDISGLTKMKTEKYEVLPDDDHDWRADDF